jgi:hypothetical protein
VASHQLLQTCGVLIEDKNDITLSMSGQSARARPRSQSARGTAFVARRAHFRGFLCDQGQRLGHRIVDLSLDRRSAGRATMGHAEQALGRYVLHDAADQGKIVQEAGGLRGPVPFSSENAVISRNSRPARSVSASSTGRNRRHCIGRGKNRAGRNSATRRHIPDNEELDQYTRGAVGCSPSAASHFSA